MANKKESNEIPEQKKNSSKVKKQPKKSETTEVLDITTFAEYKKLQEKLREYLKTLDVVDEK